MWHFPTYTFACDIGFTSTIWFTGTCQLNAYTNIFRAPTIRPVNLRLSISMTFPPYWHVMPEPDRPLYLSMQRRFELLCTRDNRQPASIEQMITEIHTFSHRRDNNDWRRFLVCGICWMDHAIAVNIAQLRHLIKRCRSSINNSLIKMGYVTTLARSNIGRYISQLIPLLEDTAHLRQWQMRMLLPSTSV